MPNQSLVDLTERTATADTDLIHVNSGGSDYKETKRNFFKGSFGIEFTSDSLLTSQIDALPATRAFEYTGIIIGNGHQTETGLPEAQVFYVTARCYASTSKIIEIVKASDPNDRYVCVRTSGGWGSWTQLPARSEITSLNNSLTQTLLPTDISSKITIRAGGYIKVGHIVILNLQFTIVNAVTSSDDLFTLPWPLGGNQAAIPLANYNSGLDTGGILYIRDNGIARLYQGASGGTSLNASGCYISRN